MLWAAEAPPSSGDTGALIGLINYGVLGLLVLLAILGYVHFKPSITELKTQTADVRAHYERQLAETRERFDRQVSELRKDYTEQIANLRKDHNEEVAILRAERDKAQDQRNAMAETFQKEWIPALTKSLSTVDALRGLMERIIDRGRGEK